MKNIIQIIYVQPIQGRSKKTGNEYDMRMAQCIVERTDKDGVAAPLIGELMLPEAFKDITPGRYEVTFEVAIGQDKRIGSRVSTMVPLPREARAAAPAAAAPAKV